MMNISTIILSPVMTEKSLARPAMPAGRQGRYTFLVDRRATKPQIRAAVEAQFSVSVMKVNTLINKSEAKRVRGKAKNQTGKLIKKAIVALVKGQKIEELEMKGEK